jgi:hypothetical protein
MKRTLKQLAAALSLGALSIGTAHAVLITQWSYTNEAGFASFTPASEITASGSSGTILDLPSTLSWGTDNTSSLVANSPVNGVIETNGAPAAGVSLTHNNFPIALGLSLETAVLRDVLQLTPLAPTGGPTFEAPTLNFEILFAETENDPSNGVCADGSARAEAFNEGGCRDIFVLNNPDELTGGSFEFDGFLYTVIITAEGLGPLSDGACAAVGASAGCIGFLTMENQTNTLQPFFQIIAQQIPEPDMLALLGLGLGALGFTRRRKQ